MSVSRGVWFISRGLGPRARRFESDFTDHLRINLNREKGNCEMALFKTKDKNYDSIVAPLQQIESDLSTYIGDQRNNISGLEEEKKGINSKISDSTIEIRKSEFTVTKIAELLGSDLEVEEEAPEGQDKQAE